MAKRTDLAYLAGGILAKVEIRGPIRGGNNVGAPQRAVVRGQALKPVVHCGADFEGVTVVPQGDVIVGCFPYIPNGHGFLRRRIDLTEGLHLCGETCRRSLCSGLPTRPQREWGGPLPFSPPSMTGTK